MNWSNDGQSIASGGDQGEIFIWSIKDIPFENIVLQSDTSEAVFTLLKPDLQLANVHFGNQIINKEIDSTVNQLILLIPKIMNS